MTSVAEKHEDVKLVPQVVESNIANSVIHGPTAHPSDNGRSPYQQHPSFVPHRGAGLLDKIAGHSKLFPDDSSRVFQFPVSMANGVLEPPPTIKVQPQGGRPQHSIRGWHSTDAVQTGNHYNTGRTTSSIPHQSFSRPLADIPFHRFSSDPRIHETRFPAPNPYDPALGMSSATVWDRQQLYMAESLPFLEDDRQFGLRQVEDYEDSDIVFLGERRKFRGPEPDEMERLNRNRIPEDRSSDSKVKHARTVISQRMDDVVGLLLEAAGVLEGNEIPMVIRGSTESTADNSSLERADSPATPTSLSPLHTLAKISAERSKVEVPTTLPRAHSASPPPDLPPSSSVWIRRGHRASNKELLTSKLRKKPYDRPNRLPSPSNTLTSSEDPAWYTDFLEFERQAATRKRSYSGRSSIFSGAGSLSNMPAVVSKKVTFKESKPAPKDPRETKSMSTEGANERAHVPETSKPVKGRPVSSSPVKRGRGRPRKLDEDTKNAADAIQRPATARPKEEPEIQVTTRSGRVVKRVMKATYD